MCWVPLSLPGNEKKKKKRVSKQRSKPSPQKEFAADKGPGFDADVLSGSSPWEADKGPDIESVTNNKVNGTQNLW